LLFIIDALKQAMKYFLLREEITKLKSCVKRIEWKEGVYTINDDYLAEYVFLCVGSEPTGLTVHNPNQEILDMLTVVNDDYSDLTKDDQVAVFGSSHSAMLAVMNLSRYTKKIVNFYRSEVVYAIPKDGWILYDDTGLKGKVAEWTKENVDKLNRVQIEDPKYAEALKSCNKIVYCTGLARVPLPVIVINGKQVDTKKLEYDLQTGKIFEKMHGFGIAFPRQVIDRVGNKELSVGIWKFMWHINEVMSKFVVAETKAEIIPVAQAEIIPVAKAEEKEKEIVEVVKEVVEVVKEKVEEKDEVK